jgi:hypothetical protein
MATTLHLVLAYISAAATALVAAEAGWRAWREAPATSLARVLSVTQLAALAITAFAGFALIAGETAADSGLHYLLAVAALLSVPAAPMFTMAVGPRRRALVTCLAALLALGFVALLFITG